MIYAIMGSQGSGKSTVLSALRDQGYNVVSRKASRSILQEWGVSLSEVNNTRELTTRFQDEILRRKIEDDLAHPASEIWFTERSFVDLFVYALVAIGKDNEYSDWIDKYYRACSQAQDHFNGIFYLPGGVFPVEYDGVRGVNQHYSKLIDTSMSEFTRQMTTACGIVEIETTSPHERAEEIINHVLTLEAVNGV